MVGREGRKRVMTCVETPAFLAPRVEIFKPVLVLLHISPLSSAGSLSSSSVGGDISLSSSILGFGFFSILSTHF